MSAKQTMLMAVGAATLGFLIVSSVPASADGPAKIKLRDNAIDMNGMAPPQSQTSPPIPKLQVGLNRSDCSIRLASLK
ncbi:MAG: hypothetical protein WBO55_14175 [Rhizobiaceae bacterium]